METYLNLDKVKIEKRKTGKQVGQLKRRLGLGKGFKAIEMMARWWFQFFLIFIPTWGNDPV